MNGSRLTQSNMGSESAPPHPRQIGLTPIHRSWCGRILQQKFQNCPTGSQGNGGGNVHNIPYLFNRVPCSRVFRISGTAKCFSGCAPGLPCVVYSAYQAPSCFSTTFRTVVFGRFAASNSSWWLKNSYLHPCLSNVKPTTISQRTNC